MRRNPIWKASANRREHPKTRGEGTYAQMVNESGDEIGKEVKWRVGQILVVILEKLWERMSAD